MTGLVRAEELSDEEIMRRYYECEEKVFDKVYFRYCPQLEQFFLKNGFTEEEAKDLASDVLLKVMLTKNRPSTQYSPSKGASFKTWLWRIAHNLMVDEMRKGRRMVNFGLQGEDGDGAVKEPIVIAEEPSPEEVFEAKELADAAFECVEALEGREKAVLSYWLEGLTQTEIAEIVETSVATVNRCLRRGLEKIKEHLEGKGFDV